MKIAICISGEIRNFNEKIISDSLNSFLKKISDKDNDIDIFLSTWEHTGVSYNLIRDNPLKKRTDINNELEKLVNINNIVSYEVEDYNKWLDGINDNIVDIMSNPLIGGESVTSPPQLYKIYKCNELKKNYEIENNFKYDVVIRTRPDLIYIDDIDLSEIDKINHINFGITGSYWPNRIFDIFFYSNSKNMDKISSSWLSLIDDVNNDFDNGLDKRDSGRLLYINAIKNDIPVKDLAIRICGVYRGEGLDNFFAFIKKING